MDTELVDELAEMLIWIKTKPAARIMAKTMLKSLSEKGFEVVKTSKKEKRDEARV